jgi:DNA-binding GntR family transcriptional regulator
MDPTLKQLALKYLREKISEGVWPSGTRLSDHTISREIGGISRTPVREAINQLAAEGVLEIRPREGAFIKMPSTETIGELYEIREMLESQCARKVAANPSPELLKSLQDCFSKIEELKNAVNPEQELLDEFSTARQRACDMEFHQHIIKAAGNKKLEKIIQDSRILTQLFSIMEKKMPASEITDAYNFHKRLLEALERKCPNDAEKVMREHIRDGLSKALARESRKPSEPRRSIPDSLKKYLTD